LRRHHRAARGRLGAEVLGLDIARNLVEAGNRRAREELDALFESQNTSQRKEATSIPATFLRVTSR
jgi:hypothetical protein